MSPRVTVLDNGLRVATQAMDSVESASLGVWVGAGTRDEEPEINGVAHLLEHMAFKGTERRSALAIAEEIEAVGGHLNAYTSRENTAYYARVLKDDAPLALDIISDILQHSVLDPEELSRERTVVLQEIGQAADTPDDIIFDHFQATAFPDQALGRPVLGTAEIVGGMQRQRLADFMSSHYGGDRLVVAAAGNVDHDALVEQAAWAFDSLPEIAPVAAEPASYSGGEFRESRDLEQLHLVFGFAGVGHQDPDMYAESVLSNLLGGGMSSRLFQEIRGEAGPRLFDLQLHRLLSRQRAVRHLCRHRRDHGRRTGAGVVRRGSQGRRGGHRGRGRPGAHPVEGGAADGVGIHLQPLRAARPAIADVRSAIAGGGAGREGGRRRCGGGASGGQRSAGAAFDPGGHGPGRAVGAV